MQLENYDLIAITKMWWDKLHHWDTAVKGYKLFRRDRQGTRGKGITLYVKKQTSCEERSLKNSHEQVEFIKKIRTK